MGKGNKINPILYQTGVLSERYIDIFMGDATGLFFLIFQPLAVAICTGLVWQGTSSTPTLYFVMLFSSIFFGCVNACREIVKEKAIFHRERLVGLKIFPYILSKLWILGLLGLGQVILFYFGIRFFMVIDGNAFLVVSVLYLSLLAGTSLGLFISSFVASDVMALALVPVFLIPQLLFSKLIMPNKSITGLVHTLESITLVKWGYDALEQVFGTSIEWMTIFKSIFILITMIFVLSFSSGFILKIKEKL